MTLEHAQAALLQPGDRALQARKQLGFDAGGWRAQCHQIAFAQWPGAARRLDHV
ncbi:hypothetical protein HNP55_004699 [Paucibacter oligotrophus]|uniref:Uncharacterized protein n=1 Tax=Roseateles oligotrophus TaxID=1769250 RepID=A0A840LGF2_9BURK|nr:hypothetical protein [Roseateles oligotrophus]MBB4846145.1 hypothetical protein [Roseateles oligotrophus]